MFNQHYTQDHIASTLHCGKRRVNNTIKSYRATGVVPTALTIGRPKKITPDVTEYVKIRCFEDASLTNEKIKAEIIENFSKSLSRQSISSIRYQAKFKYLPPRHDQDLTQVQMEKRFDFCQKMLADLNVLPVIAFSDESRFVIGDDKQWRWIRRGEETPNSKISTEKFPQSVMIFGVIGVGYKSKLLIVEGSINAQRYIQNCEEINFIEELDEKYGFLNWVFMQDGATCHTAESSLEYLENLCDVICDWPPNSPDLNPIELLWAIMKKRVAVAQRGKEITKQELIEILHTVWEEISQELIDNLCNSFEGRLRLCSEFSGNSISRHLNLSSILNDHLSRRNNNPWSEDEDKILMDMIWSHGHSWKKISALMADRDADSCKARWYSHLKHKQGEFLQKRRDQILSQN